MSFTAMNRYQFNASATNLQVRATVDCNVRLIAAQAVITVALSEECVAEDPGTVELPRNFFLIVASAVVPGPWIQRVKIRVAADMVPVRVGDEDGGQRRQPGSVGAKGFIRALRGVRPRARVNADEFTPVI